VKRLLRLLLRSGMRKGWRSGIVDGNRAWVVLGGIALVGHLAGRAIARDEDIVFKEVLKPGETFRITHRAQP
jgi:hypothetical protein